MLLKVHDFIKTDYIYFEKYFLRVNISIMLKQIWKHNFVEEI